MKAYARIEVDFPIEIPDKFTVLGGWEPKSTDRDLKDECWKEVLKALDSELKKNGIDDDYDCTCVTDENGFIMVK